MQSCACCISSNTASAIRILGAWASISPCIYRHGRWVVKQGGMGTATAQAGPDGLPLRTLAVAGRPT
jgi:hypothetical protein